MIVESSVFTAALQFRGLLCTSFVKFRHPESRRQSLLLIQQLIREYMIDPKEGWNQCVYGQAMASADPDGLAIGQTTLYGLFCGMKNSCPHFENPSLDV
ncbi:hypothetical protein Nepgr_018364 [Nepenthes gracilis]|uniref:Uncharacterized protein n=1 Tax=Nepenthes gracilis TaxID=150966 RepID=A0AAD3SS41_NEPGR|nr:hypothetical protein Nepgr_018364 [Nepenthes gracilis]